MRIKQNKTGMPPQRILSSGTRTLLYAYGPEQGAVNHIIHEGVIYQVLSSSVSYDSADAFIFPAVGDTQEHLLVSNEDPTISRHIENYLKELKACRKLDNAQCYLLLKTLISSIFSDKDNTYRVNEHAKALIANPQFTQLPIYTKPNGEKVLNRTVTPLSYWVNLKMGVCRHKNLLAFVLLGEAIEAGYLPNGKIYVINAEVSATNSAHLSLIYLPRNSRSYLIDFTAERICCDLTLSNDVITILKEWGFYTFDKNKKRGATDYLLDIMARYSVPCNIKFLYIMMTKNIFIGFLNSDSSMQETYLAWVIRCLQDPSKDYDYDFLREIQSELNYYFPTNTDVKAFSEYVDTMQQPTMKKQRTNNSP